MNETSMSMWDRFKRFLSGARPPERYESDGWNPIASFATGAPVVYSNDELSFALSTVFSCVNLRASLIAMLPFDVFRYEEVRGKRVPVLVERPPRWAQRDRQPNPWETRFTMVYRLVSGLDLDGNAYLRVLDRNRTGLYPESVANLQAQVTFPEQTDGIDRFRSNGQLYTRYTPDTRSGDVLWLRRMERDGRAGVSPIQACRVTTDMGRAAQDAVKAFLESGAGPPPGAFKLLEASKAEYDEFVGDLQQRGIRGPDKQVMVLPDGVDWVEFKVDPVALQLLESRKLSMQEICGLYLVPKQLLSMTDTTWASGVNALINFLYVSSLQPTITILEEAFTYMLPPGQFLKINASGLLRVDTVLRTNYYRMMLQTGTLTRNEVRELEDMEPLEGLDEPIAPINYGLQSYIEAIAAQAVAAAKESEDGESDGTGDGA